MNAGCTAALAGMLWSKQYYYFDVDLWLQGPRVTRYGISWPRRPEIRMFHMLNADVISELPDKWEYPWYAAGPGLPRDLPGRWWTRFRQGAAALMLARSLFHPNGKFPPTSGTSAM